VAYENKRVEALFNRICRAAGEKNLFHYRSYIEGVNQLLSADKHTRNVEMREMPISDAPIAQALGPEDTDVPAKKIWFEYHVDVVEDLRYEQELLQLQAKAAFVTEVQWRHVGQQAEIKLYVLPTTIHLTGSLLTHHVQTPAPMYRQDSSSLHYSLYLKPNRMMRYA
jgi:hypothetical protein